MEEDKARREPTRDRKPAAGALDRSPHALPPQHTLEDLLGRVSANYAGCEENWGGVQGKEVW